MAEYIYTERNGIYIIDLQKSVGKVDEAYKAVSDIAAEGGTILFVGTKKQAQEAVQTEAERCGMYYVNERWLGGMLTNFKTIQSRIKRLKDIEKMAEDGTFDVLPKKEVVNIKKEWDKLEKNLGGIKDMKRIPDAIFVVDPKKEKICVQEAHSLGITLIGIADTNCDPEELDYVIPGNDDAIRAVKLIVSKMADAVIEANQGEEMVAEDAAEEATELIITATKKDTELTYTTKVAVVPAAVSANDGLTMAEMPQANAAPKADEISQEVKWTVEGATSKNTTIDQNGNLTIAAGEKAEVLVVRATSAADPSKSGVSYVTVTPSKSILRTTYEYALTLSTEGVVDSAVKYFEDAKAAAKAVLDNPDATAEEIDTAWDNLLEGIWALGFTQGDKTMLEQLIAKAEEWKPILISMYRIPGSSWWMLLPRQKK